MSLRLIALSMRAVSVRVCMCRLQQVLFGWLWQSVAFLFSHRLLSYSLLITAAASIAAVIVAGPESEVCDGHNGGAGS